MKNYKTSEMKNAECRMKNGNARSRLRPFFILHFAFFICFLTGCAHNRPAGSVVSQLGPPLLETGVYAAAYAAGHNSASAVPPLRVAASVFCAAANGTNVTPSDITAALEASLRKNPSLGAFVPVVVNLYSAAYNGLADKSAVAASPYLDAVCSGINSALLVLGPVDGVNAPLARARSPKAAEQIHGTLPNAKDWPQPSWP